MANNSYGWAAPVVSPVRTGGGGGSNSRGVLWDKPVGQPTNGFQAFANPQASASMLMPQIGAPPTMPPGYGGAQPRYTPFAMPPSTGQSNPFMDAMLRGGITDPSKYDENFRNMMEGYSNYSMIPYSNALNAGRTLDQNAAFGAWDRNEQGRLNDHTMGLANRGATREDTALNFGMKTNERDYGEGVRQFDKTLGRDMFGLETNRMDVKNRNTIDKERNRIAQYEAETGRVDVEGRRKLEEFANNTARMGVTGGLENDKLRIGNEYDLGLGKLDNDRFNNQTTRDLGQGALDNDRTRIGNEMTLGQGRLGLDRERDMGRLGLDTELGRGALGFQNRELDVNDAYRQKALGQEADLSRERMRSDELNNRYQVFGRSQAPNVKANRSFY
jgi:hypothetical protein